MVPKGLQAKAVNTGLELPPDLYELWENAHITLGNTRRDILIQYWSRQLSDLEKAINEATARLNTTGTDEEVEQITTTQNKTKLSKAEELKTRHLRKAENAIAASGGGNTKPQPTLAPCT